jgi:hypothetical protein
MVKQLPWPGFELTSMRPPCCSTILLAMNRPSPVPLRPLDEKKTVKSLERVTSSMPMPVSLTENLILSPWAHTQNRNSWWAQSSLRWQASMALSKVFINAEWTWRVPGRACFACSGTSHTFTVSALIAQNRFRQLSFHRGLPIDSHPIATDSISCTSRSC